MPSHGIGTTWFVGSIMRAPEHLLLSVTGAGATSRAGSTGHAGEEGLVRLEHVHTMSVRMVGYVLVEQRGCENRSKLKIPGLVPCCENIINCQLKKGFPYYLERARTLDTVRVLIAGDGVLVVDGGDHSGAGDEGVARTVDLPGLLVQSF